MGENRPDAESSDVPEVESATGTEPPPAPKKHRTGVIVGVALAALVLAGAAYAGWTSWSNHQAAAARAESLARANAHFNAGMAALVGVPGFANTFSAKAGSSPQTVASWKGELDKGASTAQVEFTAARVEVIKLPDSAGRKAYLDALDAGSAAASAAGTAAANIESDAFAYSDAARLGQLDEAVYKLENAAVDAGNAGNASLSKTKASQAVAKARLMLRLTADLARRQKQADLASQIKAAKKYVALQLEATTIALRLASGYRTLPVSTFNGLVDRFNAIVNKQGAVLESTPGFFVTPRTVAPKAIDALTVASFDLSRAKTAHATATTQLDSNP